MRTRQQAQARAVAERRARRLTLVLAVVGVLLVGGATAGGMWLHQRAQEERRQDEARAVRIAEKSEKVRKAGEEIRSNYRSGKWLEAQQALKEAVGLVQDGEVEETLRQEVLALASDFQVVRDLEQARMQRCGMRGCVFDYERADPEKVFQSCGIDVLKLPVEEAAGRIRQHELIREELVASLDDWAYVLKTLEPQKTYWPRLLDVADRCDDSPLRAQLRQALRQKENQRQTLRRWAASPEIQKESPATIVLLASALVEAGAVGQAIRLLEEAVLRHQENFWINLKLGEYLARDRFALPALTRALPYFHAAAALRPDNPIIVSNLATLHNNLGDPDRAIKEFHRALELPHPQRARVMDALATVYSQKSDNKMAEHWYRQAIQTEPAFAPPYVNLGCLYSHMGRLKEAIDLSLAGRERAPTDTVSRYNLANMMLATKKPDEAKKYSEEANGLQRAEPNRRFAFAVQLGLLGRKADTIKELAEVQKDDPTNHAAAGIIGSIYLEMGQSGRARAAFRKACELKPDAGQYHLGLGQSFLQQGQYREALVAIAKGKPHLADGTPQRKQLDDLVQACNARLKLEAKLLAVRDSRAQPATPEEGRLLATMCHEKGLYVTSLRLWEQLLAKEDATARPGDCYNAACAAVRATGGQGEERAAMADHPRLRGLALGWLRAERTTWDRIADKEPGAQAFIHKTLSHWREDADLVGVREADALGRIGVEERAVWRKFWGEVDARIGKLTPSGGER